MNKKIFTLLVSILLTASLFAQNLSFTQYIPPRARNINAVHMSPNGTLLVFGGNPVNDSIAHVSYTKDGGTNWNIVLDKPRDPMIFDVHYISEQNAIAVGDRNGIWKSTDGGESWTSVSAPSSLNTRQLRSVFFTSSMNGFIAGGNLSNDSIQTLLKTSDGGNTWSIVFDRLGDQLNKVYFNGSKGFLLGNNGTFLSSTDNGSSWQPVSLTGNLSQRSYYSMSFANATTGIAVGGNLMNDSIQTILRTIDGGTSWSIIKDNISPMLRDVDFMQKGKSALAVGNNGRVLESRDTGKTWQNVTLSGVDDNWQFNCVDFVNGKNAMIGGRAGALFFSYDQSTLSSPVFKQIEVNLYPNPASKYIHIQTKEELSYIEIFNSLGQKTLSSSNLRNINVSHFKIGVYQIRILLPNGDQMNKLIQIIK